MKIDNPNKFPVGVFMSDPYAESGQYWFKDVKDIHKFLLKSKSLHDSYNLGLDDIRAIKNQIRGCHTLRHLKTRGKMLKKQIWKKDSDAADLKFMLFKGEGNVL